MRWSSSLSVAIISSLYLLSIAAESRICQYNPDVARYSCRPALDEDINHLELPSSACMHTNCGHCVTAKNTFILTDEDQLLDPSTFFDRPTKHMGNISTFNCVTAGEPRGDAVVFPCDCANNCSGTPEFCALFPCEREAPCHCAVTKVKHTFSHVSSTSEIISPTFLTIDMCLHKLPTKSRRTTRHLLEFEAATFTQHNLTITFHDPVVSLPEAGKLIARVSGNEIVIDAKTDLNVVLPIEFTAFKNTLTLIFISSSGKAVFGEVFLEGKSICRATDCFFCKEFLLQLQCWPPYVSYVLYVFLIIVTLTALCFLKMAFRGLYFTIRIIFTFFRVVFHAFKSVLRFFMLGGAVFGTTVRRHFHDFELYLENQHVQRRDVAVNLPLLVLCGLFIVAGSDCTSHSILSSDIQNCKDNDGLRVCDLFTTAEVTLKGLDYESCIWFQDKTKKDVFHLKLTLVSAQCTFSSKRKYFTFPVKERTLSQLACPQNTYCAWGEHCKPNQKFEALTDESMDYPGFTNCLPSSVGSGCTIISRMGCLFFRVYFIPELLHSYEVRTILGHQCTYTVAVERSFNNTKELLTFQSTAQTSDGIHLDILGSYNQAPLHFSDSLIIRVGNPSEAYLAQTSPHNRPIAGMVGQVQANTSFTKDFIFDKEIVRCDFFETTLRCQTTSDDLAAIIKDKDRALPLSRDLHLLTIEKGIMKSKLLSTAPVRLQLSFKNYQISLETNDVCPKITTNEITTKGCYSCQILGEMTFKALSSCQAGRVSVEFQILQVFTRTVLLDTEPKDIVIQFLAEFQCYDEKICLVSRTMKSCHKLSFCLNEPSINLRQLNTSYTRSFLQDSSADSNIFSFLSMPTLNSIFFSMKFIGAFLLILCLGITFISTCITCCTK